MRNFKALRRLIRHVRSDQRGISLIEVVISVALIGVTGVALLQSLSGMALGKGIHDDRVGAVVAGRTQLESVKQDLYDNSVTSTPGPAYADLPTQFTVGGILFDTQIVGQLVEPGVQLITVIVSDSGQEITSLQAYKTNR